MWFLQLQTKFMKQNISESVRTDWSLFAICYSGGGTCRQFQQTAMCKRLVSGIPGMVWGLELDDLWGPFHLSHSMILWVVVSLQTCNSIYKPTTEATGEKGKKKIKTQREDKFHFLLVIGQVDILQAMILWEWRFPWDTVKTIKTISDLEKSTFFHMLAFWCIFFFF